MTANEREECEYPRLTRACGIVEATGSIVWHPNEQLAGILGWFC